MFEVIPMCATDLLPLWVLRPLAGNRQTSVNGSKVHNGVFFQNFYGATWIGKRSPFLYHFWWCILTAFKGFCVIGENWAFHLIWIKNLAKKVEVIECIFYDLWETYKKLKTVELLALFFSNQKPRFLHLLKRKTTCCSGLGQVSSWWINFKFCVDKVSSWRRQVILTFFWDLITPHWKSLFVCL